MSARLLRSLFVCLCLVAPLASGCSLRGDESGGEEILFVRGMPTSSAIYLMSEDGRDVRRLVAGDSPRWSPDGSRFAYVVKGNNVDGLWLMDPDAQEKRRVARVEPSIVALAWAPDGVRLAYTDGQQVFVVNTETGDSKPVSIYLSLQGPLDWSPDGRTLLVSSSASVLTLDLDTGAERSVAPRRWVEDGRWSPDGERIAMAERNHPYNPRRNAFDFPADGVFKSAIVVTGRSGGSRERVTDGSFDFDPAWSDDGERIYFARQPAGHIDEDVGPDDPSEIYVVELETRTLRRLTDTAPDRSPEPRPDHRSLPDPLEPTTGDVVVPDLVGRHIRLESESPRFRALGLKLTALVPPEPGWLLAVEEQVPRGGSRVPPGTVVKVYGFDLAGLYVTPNLGTGKPFSSETWKAHPECTAERHRASMYSSLVRRVLRKGMSREQILSLLGKPGKSRPATAAWPIGQLSILPVDCIYLRVDFDRSRVARFYQSTS